MDELDEMKSQVSTVFVPYVNFLYRKVKNHCYCCMALHVYDMACIYCAIHSSQVKGEKAILPTLGAVSTDEQAYLEKYIHNKLLAQEKTSRRHPFKVNKAVL